MATRLKNIVRFFGVDPGATASLPHGLAWDGEAKVPDRIDGNAADFDVSADDTDVTVTNHGAVKADIDVLCTLWHTIERAFGDVATLELSPRPFVMTPEGSAGALANLNFFLPDAWEMNDVQPNLADAVVSSSISQLFDEIVVNRGMSILGIRTRLSGPIVAGNLTVKVSVNGVATAAVLLHNAGSNPSGGGVTFAGGTVVVVPGDLVGVLVDTDGAFDPATLDLQVRVEAG